MNKDNKDKRNTAEARKLYHTGMKYFREKHYFDALQMFQQAVQNDPEYKQAHLKMARTYLKLKDESSAAVCYEEFLNYESGDTEALDFLYDYYTKKHYFESAGDVLGKKIAVESNENKKNELTRIQAEVYFKAEAYEKAEKAYLQVLLEDAYNPQIFENLKHIYDARSDHRRWKVCHEILVLNNRTILKKPTRDISVFKVDAPLDSELMEELTHPKEVAFKSFFGWLKPLFKLMEQSTAPEILRAAESAENEEVYALYKDCAHYLNMPPPPLQHYSGPVKFKFIADPLEEDGAYGLIYHDDYIEGLTSEELVFQFFTQLVLIKSNFISLLNLSLSDVSKMLLELAGIIFGVLSVFKSVNIGKAAKMFQKSEKSKKLFAKVMGFQNKLAKFKLMGKTLDDIPAMIKSSVGLLPDKLKDNKELDRKTVFNRKFLKSLLPGFFLTADRIAYYYTRDLLSGTRALLKLLETGDTLERVNKFGLVHYVSESKNTLLRQRLAELYIFALQSDAVR